MVKLRLTRLGRKRVPFYRIAAMEALSRRDGKAIAYLGTYNPLAEDGKQVVLKEEEIRITSTLVEHMSGFDEKFKKNLEKSLSVLVKTAEKLY